MEWRAMILLNAAAAMERADEALLPAVYSEVSESFGIGPSALGWLTFIRALVQALASPLAAYLALTYNRVHVISLGAIVWAVATALVGISNTYWQAAVAKAINGVGLAIVVPAIQSMVADSNREGKRGFAFGFLHASGQLGNLLGGLFATLLGGMTFYDVPGWRIAFLIVAALSLLLGLGVYSTVTDPSSPGWTKSKSVGEKTQELTKGIGAVVKLRTFQVIVAQGVVGQFPWNAMLFFTLWMELLGFSHGLAALCVALLSGGNAAGSVFGGWIGDTAAAYFPDGGRVMCSQFSAGVGIPLSAVLLLGLPRRAGFAWAYGLVLCVMGFLMSWNSPATNWPIFAEIVPVELRTTVYAVDMALEKSLAAVGAPLVGFLAELFGFEESVKKPDLRNADSLARGLFPCIAVPFLLCVVIISGLYFTYPKDRDSVKTSKEYARIVDDDDEETTSDQA